MRRELRYLCVVSASALLFFGLAPDTTSGLGPSDSLAQGKSGDSPGRGGSSPGNSGSSSGKSGSSPGHSSSTPGLGGSIPSALQANNGKNSSSGPHQLAEDLGFSSMGEFSSWLKSWRSAYRNGAGYAATEGNLHSLPGRQYAYGVAYFELQNVIGACTAAVCDPDDPLFDDQDALAADVVAAATTADAAFMATLPGNPTTYDPDLREDIDALLVQLSGANAGLF